MKDINQDEREIEALYFPNDSEFKVGRGGVTKIEPYYEAGQCAAVPWFMVWKGNTIAFRVNAATLATVKYAEEPE